MEVDQLTPFSRGAEVDSTVNGSHTRDDFSTLLQTKKSQVIRREAIQTREREGEKDIVLCNTHTRLHKCTTLGSGVNNGTIQLQSRFPKDLSVFGIDKEKVGSTNYN